MRLTILRKLNNLIIYKFLQKVIILYWQDVVIKTLISCQPILKHNYRTCFPNHNVGSACFEILGFDVMLDNKMKAWVLEVSLSIYLTCLNNFFLNKSIFTFKLFFSNYFFLLSFPLKITYFKWPKGFIVYQVLGPYVLSFLSFNKLYIYLFLALNYNFLCLIWSTL